jgi:hypothetical protein
MFSLHIIDTKSLKCSIDFSRSTQLVDKAKEVIMAKKEWKTVGIKKKSMNEIPRFINAFRIGPGEWHLFPDEGVCKEGADQFPLAARLFIYTAQFVPSHY